MNADARQADTNATTLAALDLLLDEGAIDDQRLQELEGPLNELLGDASETEATSEGNDALDHLLNVLVRLDHGAERNVRELLKAALLNEPCDAASDPKPALARYGIILGAEGGQVAIKVEKSTQISRIYGGSKWSSGAHKTALLQIEGVVCPKDPVRIPQQGKQPVILIPIDLLELGADE